MASAELQARIRAAEAATQQAGPAGAAQAWRRVLELDPAEPQALFLLGRIALDQGRAAEARDLLGKASRSNPGEPMIWYNLALACRAAGDVKAEAEALTGALTADPYCYPAMLARGEMLERVGQPRRAAQVYRDALKIAPPEDRVFPPLRPALARARDSVRRNSEAFAAALEERFADLRSGRPAGELSRFDESRDIMLGRTRPYHQEPTLHHIPRLPAIPFYEREDFPWLAGIEARTGEIAEELKGLLGRRTEDFSPYVSRPPGAPLDDWAELNNSLKWGVFFLCDDGKPVQAHRARCPRTVEALKGAPQPDVPGAGPTAFFSALEPRTHIPPHTGVTNTRLIVHLPLVVPPGCRFRVGNEVREWRVGEALVFDDTIEHEVWNDSDEVRVVLIFDIWNPYLTEVERELSRRLIAGYKAWYEA